MSDIFGLLGAASIAGYLARHLRDDHGYSDERLETLFGQDIVELLRQLDANQPTGQGEDEG